MQKETVEREIIWKCCCGQANVLWQPGQGASTQGEGWGEGQPDLSERGYRECLGEHGDVPGPGGAASTFPTTHLPQARLAGASSGAHVLGVL